MTEMTHGTATTTLFPFIPRNLLWSSWNNWYSIYFTSVKITITHSWNRLCFSFWFNKIWYFLVSNETHWHCHCNCCCWHQTQEKRERRENCSICKLGTARSQILYSILSHFSLEICLWKFVNVLLHIKSNWLWIKRPKLLIILEIFEHFHRFIAIH